MGEIQATHAYSDAYQNTHDALRALSQVIQARQYKVRHLRTRIEDIEMQNNRIMRLDEHKRALVAKGKDLMKFFKVSNDQEEVLNDAELYRQGEDDDMKQILKCLDAVK